jgi:hypothetical protein
VVEQRVGEIADAVLAARCRRLLVHSVEQVVGTEMFCKSGEATIERGRRGKRKCVEYRINSHRCSTGCSLLRLPALSRGERTRRPQRRDLRRHPAEGNGGLSTFFEEVKRLDT